jgi:hypothetical protein
MIRRETVYVALLNLLTTTGDFKLVSRRNRAPEQIGPALSPALFLFERGETYHDTAPGIPTKRCLRVSACFYNDAGSDLNATPTTIVNDALDALDAALKIHPVTGPQTLGGLVYSVKISGDTEGSPGDRDGRAAAIVPIEIVLP